MKATEILEELERKVHEYGDGEAELPDPMESLWWYRVDRVEFNPETQTYRFVSDR